MEKPYEFKEKLLLIHKKDIRDFSAVILDSEVEIFSTTKIVKPKNCTPVIDTAVDDFIKFMDISMNIKMVNDGENKNSIILSLNKDLGDASGYMGFRISFKDNDILVEGFDDRGVMQGIYYLEEQMSLRKAPYLEKKSIGKKALFSPRFSQSPLGMFQFSDECFAHLSHQGYDAIDLWIKGYNLDHRKRFLDMNDICDRAEKYGIDIYIDLYAHHSRHPSDSDAEEFYDKLYGDIFDACPKIKGTILEGETSQFNSHDPNAGLSPRQANYIENIPTGKCTPGWWPCVDYPEWVALIQKVIKRHKKDAKVILSTYNWGYAPYADRAKLIKNLPDDVAVLATFEMFEQRPYGKSIQDGVDYTLAFAGPGKYFISEATATKERGLKLYSIANTSGKTWDFGVIPYEPMPYQWINRYENMVKAHDEYNLCGLIENIHYAFYPSIINELEKQAFFTNGENLCGYLDKLIVRDYGKDNLEKVKSAFKIWSDAITFYTPTNEDQYGTFRIGPSYPFWINNPAFGLNPLPEQGKHPADESAMFGNCIYFSYYTPDVAGRNSLPGVRIYDEIKSIEKMRTLLGVGINILESIENKNEELSKLLNLGKFIKNCCTTTLNFKHFYIETQKISIIGSKKKAKKCIDNIENILLAERENVTNTIPLVNFDSRLGYEPSMEYMTNEPCLQWKLRQIDHELKFTIPKYRKSNSL